MRILIAEDQLLERRILETGLRKSGHDVESFADGESAWERFQEEPARLVITDWVMPRMNGVDLIQRIRAADSERHTYTILLTSRGDKDDVVDGLASGADDYLTKPFDHRELAARVEIGKRMIQLEDSLLATQEHLERLATYDSLTGLLNRQSVLERAGVELRRAWRTGGRMGLVMVDVDRFKDVNDRHGHAQGDSVLKAVAACLAQHTRPYDLVGRWGGEEFLIALPGADVEEARQIAERMRVGVAQLQLTTPTGEAIPVRVSAGVAATPSEDVVDLQQLLLDADRALLSAKRGGRDRIHIAGQAGALARTADSA